MPGDDGALRLEISDGDGCEPRSEIPLGPVGALIMVGDGATQPPLPLPTHPASTVRP
jgi:hypothetical protein